MRGSSGKCVLLIGCWPICHLTLLLTFGKNLIQAVKNYICCPRGTRYMYLLQRDVTLVAIYILSSSAISEVKLFIFLIASNIKNGVQPSFNPLPRNGVLYTFLMIKVK